MEALISLFWAIFIPLALTIAVESIPLFLFSPQGKWLFAGLVCNLLTNPMLNSLRILFYNLYPHADALFILTVALEILVVCVEGWIYRELLGIDYKKAFCVALLCNSLSYFIGLLLL